MSKEQVLSKEQSDIENKLLTHAELEEVKKKAEEYIQAPANLAPLVYIQKLLYSKKNIQVIILPNDKKSYNHNKPLSAPFGTTIKKIIFKMTGAPPAPPTLTPPLITKQYKFKVDKGPAAPGIGGYYQFFLMDGTGKKLDKTKYGHSMTTELITSKKIRKGESGISTKITFKPKLGSGNYYVFLFVSVQLHKYSAAEQEKLNKLIYYHFIIGGKEAELKKEGMLDFNFIPLRIEIT